MKRLLATAVALCSMLFASLAPATTASVNYNDMWWNPTESGWGVNIAQQGATLFLTFFVYGADSKPTWVVGILTKTGQTASGQPIFTGNTYATTGPYYGIPFNAADYHADTAGTASFIPTDAVSGTLKYSIGNVTVTKPIQRQTLVNDNVAGSYRGIWRLTFSCPPAAAQAEEVEMQGTITQTGTQFQYVETDDLGNVCTWTGAWSQSGVLGRVDGTLSCVDGSNGTFTMSEIASSQIGISGRVSASGMINLPPLASCTVSGTFGALRR